MTSKPTLFVLIALASLPTAGVAQSTLSDWRAFRGNDGFAVSNDKGLPQTWSPTENLVWKTTLPGAGSSTPVVIQDRVYVTCYSGYNMPGKPKGDQADLKLHLVCLDRKSGEVRWKKDLAPKLPEQENIRDGHGYATSTPVVDESRVIAFFGKTGVFAFDHTGNQLWQTDVGSELNGWGSAASLLRFENLVIVNASVESETLYALDVATGKEVWSVGKIKESWNTPILATHNGKTELVVAIFGKILGIEPKTGKELWKCATDIPWYMVPSLVAKDGVVYALGGRPGGGLAVKLGGQGDVTESHRLWTSKKGSNVSSPVFHEGHLYWMHDNLGVAFCANAKTGEVVYETRLPRGDQVYGSAVLADGKIYYPSRDGRWFVVAAKPEFELLATNRLEDRQTLNSSISVAGGKIFLRTDSAAYCLGTK